MSLKTTLRSYQREAVKKALRHDGFAFFNEQRTGKCLCSIAVIDERKPDIVLIICPKKALRVWSKEFKKHIHFDWECYVRYVHYEASSREADDRKRYYRLAKKWQKQGRSVMVVVDEIHRCKKRGTKQSRFVRTLGKRACYRLALTGTPIAQGHKDAWAIFDFISPHIFGKWEDFASEFLRTKSFERRDGRQYSKIIGTRNEEEFMELFHKYSYRITLREARRSEGLPGARIRHSRVPITLERSSWITYRELEKDLETVVHGQVVSTPLILTLSMKLQQVAGGYVLQDTRVPGKRKKKRVVHTLGAEKMAGLERLLARPKLQGKKLVICCRFKHEIQRIVWLLGDIEMTHRIVSGKHEFKGEFDTDVIILQIQSGEAVDFSASNTYIFYSWNQSMINYEQSRFRVQAFDTRQVNYYYLIATDTVDEDMYESVVKKRNLSTLICDRYRKRKNNEKCEK